jgi:hypothetical protein
MSTPTSAFDRKARLAFMIVSVVLLASGFGFDWAVKQLNVYLRKLPVEMRGSFDTIPRALGRWRAVGKDRIVDDAFLDELGTRIYLDRHYALEGNPSLGLINLHLTYYTGMIDTVPHIPDRCFVAAGMNLKSQPENLSLRVSREDWRIDSRQVNLATREPYWLAEFKDFSGQLQTVRMPVGELRIRASQFEKPDQPELRIWAGYFFIANGRSTWTPLGVKALAFDPTERYAYYCKVQCTYADRDATQERFVALVSDLLAEVLPELMHRLPDWAEVERRTDSQRKSNEPTGAKKAWLPK